MSEVKMARFEVPRASARAPHARAHMHTRTCLALHACTCCTYMAAHASVAPACSQGGFEVPRRGVIAAVQPTGSEVVLMLVR